MKKGKAKCKALKEIRKQIADANDIPYVVSQCTYQGDCKGTCPKCEAELKYLERELAIRTNLGKAVAIAGISVGACSTLTACAPIDEAAHFLRTLTREEATAGAMVAPEELDGDIAMPVATEEPLEGEALPPEELSGDVAMPVETEEPLEGKLVAPEETPSPAAVEGELTPDSEETCPVETETMLAGDIEYNPEWDDTYEGGIEYQDPEATN